MFKTSYSAVQNKELQI